MNKERLEELRKLAEIATPGPWRWGVDGGGRGGGWKKIMFTEVDGSERGVAWQVCASKDAMYIAAVDPNTVIELMDEIECQRDHIDGLRDLLGSKSDIEA